MDDKTIKKIRLILKDWFYRNRFQPISVKEDSFIGYHAEILKERLKVRPANRIIYETGAMSIYEYLPWDSDIFKMKIARLDYFISLETAGRLSREKVIKNVFSLAKKQRIRFLSAKVNTGDFQAAQALERYGFILADMQLTLSVVPAEAELGIPDKNIRPCRRSDFKVLIDIARDSFCYNRFFNDPGLNRNDSSLVYAQWVKNACLKNPLDLLVWDEAGIPQGFIICKMDKHAENFFGFGIGQIDLVAVGPSNKSKGIGRKLVNAALCRFAKDKAALAEIRTQYINIAAVTSFMRAGFKHYSTGLSFPAGMTFHKWFE
jgi:ribosomal protein S18 acetylase RimI-like enzyme